MPGLSKKDTAKLLAHIEPQGVKVTNVKNGFMLRLPNGESTTVHLTGSDYRGPLNLRAFLKRNGIDWPTDKGDIKVTKKTQEYGERVLIKMGNPQTLRARDFITAALLDDWVVAGSTVTNFLHFKGYEAVGNTTQRRFIMPAEIVIEDPHPIVSIAKEPLPTILTKESTLEVREFLDTHDSWTVNMDILPDTLTIGDMKLMFAAIGITFEVRVWK